MLVTVNRISLCRFCKVIAIKPFGLVYLIVTIPENLGYEEAFDEIFNKFGIAYELRKVKTTELGSLYELVYMVTIDHLTNQKDFLDAIRCRNGNLDITLTMNPTEAAQY